MENFIFKAKSLKTKEWVEGYYVPVSHGHFPCSPCIVPEPRGRWESIPVDKNTLCVYFGQYDKNDKKIFTGDFVYDETTQMFGKVVFDLSFFGVLDIFDGFQVIDSFIDINAWSSVEIVGNAFDDDEEEVFKRITGKDWRN